MPTQHATWGLWYWPSFILAVVALFSVPEIVALITNTYNTLSWFAWRAFGFPRPGVGTIYTAAWYFSFALYLVIVTFLAIHIWFFRLR